MNKSVSIIANQNQMIGDIRTIVQISRACEFIETTIPNNSASIGSSYKERSSKRKERLHFHTQKLDVQQKTQENRRTVVDVGDLHQGIYTTCLQFSSPQKPNSSSELGRTPALLLATLPTGPAGKRPATPSFPWSVDLY